MDIRLCLVKNYMTSGRENNLKHIAFKIILLGDTMSALQKETNNHYKKKYKKVKIGIFGAGYSMYWKQFKGLKERVVKHQEYFEDKIREYGFDVISGGLSDTHEKAVRIGDLFKSSDVDFVMLFMSTYAQSSLILPVIQKASVPVVIISLQPRKSMEYDDATMFSQLELDNQTSLPEVCATLMRANIPPAGMVVGMLYDDKKSWDEIYDWCKIARAYAHTRKAKIGLMGHVLEGQLDIQTDPTLLSAYYGMHCPHIEIDILHKLVKEVKGKELKDKINEINILFEFPESAGDEITSKAKPKDIEWSALVACGIEKLIKYYDLDGLAYYYSGLDNDNELLGASLIVGSSILIGKGIPIAGEYDIRTAITMLLADRLEAGGCFAELHPVDFKNDIVYVGHDGPHHIAVADGKPVIRALSVYHGKRGCGLSVEFKLKNGPMTLINLTQTYEGKLKYVVAEGESVPGMIPPNGNTNTRGKFSPDVASFIKNWSMEGTSHHFVLAIGHIANLVESYARCWGIECVNVTDPLYKRKQYVK